MPQFHYVNHGPVDFSTSFMVDADTFKNKSVLVTGAASGLGEAFSRELAQLGAFVILSDINVEKGRALAKEIGPNARFVHCDVTAFRSQVDAFEYAISHSPRRSLDYVLANAGIAARDKTFDPEDIPTEPALAVMNTNLTGVIYTAKLALHYFRRSVDTDPVSHCLLITSSLAGYLDLPSNPLYTVSKFGARALMRTLRWTSPFRVNVIAPWFIQTSIMSEGAVGLLDSVGMGWATTEDCAKAVVRILADEGVNGRAIGVVPQDVVPGGLTDLEEDDYEKEPGSKGEWMPKWQERLLKLHARMEDITAERARRHAAAG